MPQPELLTLTIPVRTLADPADLLDAALALKDYLQGETCEPVEVLEDDVSVVHGLPAVPVAFTQAEVKALRAEVTDLREESDQSRRAYDGLKATADTLGSQVGVLRSEVLALTEERDQSRRALAVLRSLLLAGGTWTEAQVDAVMAAVEAAR